MKNLTKLLLSIALFASFNIYGQSIKTLGTTLEEYNYITKGYKVQIESGLDMKKGYDTSGGNRSSRRGRGGSCARKRWLADPGA